LSTTEIYVARHGETEYNRQGKMQGRGIDVPLNKTGRLQARAISEVMQNKSLDHIFSSSLMRSMETAEIIAWSLRMKYQSFPELDEMNFGRFEGKPSREIEEDLRGVHQMWKSGQTDFIIEGGESPEMVLERVLSRTDSILRENVGSTMLFVLHGRLIRILMSNWLEYPLSDMHRIKHSNGALYHVRMNDEKFDACYLNKTDHLEGIPENGL